MRQSSRRILSAAGPLLVVLIAVVGGTVGGAAVESIVSFGLINLILVVGLSIFVGNTGIVSFGHAAFVAIGAYVGALTSISVTTKAILLPDLPGPLDEITLPFGVSIILAGMAAALVAFVLGVPLMRLNGLAASIGTLAMLIIVRDVTKNAKSITGGAGTLNGIPIQASLPVIALVAGAAILVALLFGWSRSGRLARAAREDRVAAEALGSNIARERLGAFVVSAAVVGAGGAVYAAQLGAIAVDSFYLQLTFVMLAMLVIGGMTSTWGATVGTVAVTAMQQGLVTLQNVPAFALPPGTALVVVAVILLAVLLLRPQGITGGRELDSILTRARARETGRSDRTTPHGGDEAARTDQPERGASVSQRHG